MAVISYNVSLQYKTPDKITTYLDQIQATPAERTATVGATARHIMYQLCDKKSANVENIDAFLSWADANHSGSANPIIGDILGYAYTHCHMPFEEAFPLALLYHEKSGSDEVLTSFLANDEMNCYPENARKIAEKISDPAKRAEALGNIK